MILDQRGGQAIAAQLFSCATADGAEALGVLAGEFRVGALADGFTVDRNDLSIARTRLPMREEIVARSGEVHREV